MTLTLSWFFLGTAWGVGWNEITIDKCVRRTFISKWLVSGDAPWQGKQIEDEQSWRRRHYWIRNILWFCIFTIIIADTIKATDDCWSINVIFEKHSSLTSSYSSSCQFPLSLTLSLSLSLSLTRSLSLSLSFSLFLSLTLSYSLSLFLSL